MGKLDVLLAQRAKLAKTIDELGDHLIEVNRQIEALLERAHSPQPFDQEREAAPVGAPVTVPSSAAVEVTAPAVALARVPLDRGSARSEEAANSDGATGPGLGGLPQAA